MSDLQKDSRQSLVESMSSGARSSMLLQMTKDGEELPIVIKEEGKSDVIATTTSLITIMVGAGVLSFPSLFAKTGIACGTIMVIGCASLSVYLCKALSDAIGLCQNRTGKFVNKLDDLGQELFGYPGALAARIIVNGMFIAKIGCYMVLIGQNFAYLIPFPYRAWVLAFTALIMVSAFARDVSILEKMSIVGVIASVMYFIAIVGGSIKSGNADGSFDNPPPVVFSDMFSVLTIMMFGFGPSDVLATVRRDMKDPEQLTKALIASHLVVGFIYLSAGIVGYWGFGSAVQGNISLSMCAPPGCPGTPDPTAPPGVHRVLTIETAGSKWTCGYLLAGAVVANLMVTIPIVLYCLFTGIEAYYPKDKPMPRLANVAMRVVVVVMCSCVGLFVPFFLQVVGIMSAVLVVPVVFFLPLLFGWKSARDSGHTYSWFKKAFSISLFFLGVACFVIGFKESATDLANQMNKNPDAKNPFNNFFE